MENKITKEELEKAQEVSNNLNNTVSQLGNIKLIESDLLVKAIDERSKVEAIKLELQKKYGNIDIDLNTGEYSESNKKD